MNSMTTNYIQQERQQAKEANLCKVRVEVIENKAAKQLYFSVQPVSQNLVYLRFTRVGFCEEFF